MKKITKLFTVLLFIQLIAGCNLMESKDSKTETADFDMKVVEETVNNYMDFLVKNDMDSAKKLYSKELSKDASVSVSGSLKVIGFVREESNRVGKTGVIKLKVVKSDESKPYTVLESSTIKIEKEENNYKIKEIKNIQENEVFLEKFKLRYREKENVKTNLLMELDGIPEYAFSKEDKANLSKEQIDKKNFGRIALAYSGESMAFSTVGNNCFYGIVNIDPSLAAAGEDSASGAGGSASGDSGDQNKIDIKEKPVGKDIIALDLLKDSSVENLVFSQDEKYIAVQYKNKDNERSIKLYTARDGNMVSFKFEDNFNLKEKDVILKTFDNDKLNFQVVDKNVKGSAKPEVQNWQLDLKTFKAKEI